MPERAPDDENPAVLAGIRQRSPDLVLRDMREEVQAIMRPKCPKGGKCKIRKTWLLNEFTGKKVMQCRRCRKCGRVYKLGR